VTGDIRNNAVKAATDCAYAVAGACILPSVLYRAARHGRYRSGWDQRFGNIKRRFDQKRCVWIHAVSVGEVNAARTLIEGIRRLDEDLEVLVTSTTDTGYARAKALYGDRLAVCYFPLDFSLVMRRAFRRIRPSLCLLVELEVWPNFVRRAAELNVPVAVVNGRLTEKSCRRYERILPFARAVFGRLSLVLAQDEIYAERFRRLGVRPEKTIVTGSLKYDTAEITDTVEGSADMSVKLGIKESLFVAGGTGNGEEQAVLEAFEQIRKDPALAGVTLAVVPRKPERFDQVADMIAGRGLPLVRYSRLKRGETAAPTERGAVILGDTMGDLRKFYCLADVVFVGRSLVPMGGSDMIEAAALGKPVIFGPHTYNFTETAEALVAAEGAIRVEDKDELAEAVKKCLLDGGFARRTAEKGREVIRTKQGATARTIERIAALLGEKRIRNPEARSRNG
jgi:3-deoxy-D-manno-octulosonic-acid transferase